MMDTVSKNELTTAENIENLVYRLREKQVMLDSDLAEIYGYEVKFQGSADVLVTDYNSK